MEDGGTLGRRQVSLNGPGVVRCISMCRSGSHSSLLVSYVHSRALRLSLTYRAPSGGKSVSTTTREELILRDSVSLRVAPSGNLNNLESQSAPFVSWSVLIVLVAIRLEERERERALN